MTQEKQIMNLKTNDNSPLANMAGDNPATHQVDITQQKMKTFGAQIAQNEERILRETCPLDLTDPENKVRVTGTVTPDGVKTYSIDGNAFVRIMPPVIESDFGGFCGNEHKIMATTKWEKLES